MVVSETPLRLKSNLFQLCKRSKLRRLHILSTLDDRQCGGSVVTLAPATTSALFGLAVPTQMPAHCLSDIFSQTHARLSQLILLSRYALASFCSACDLPLWCSLGVSRTTQRINTSIGQVWVSSQQLIFTERICVSSDKSILKGFGHCEKSQLRYVPKRVPILRRLAWTLAYRWRRERITVDVPAKQDTEAAAPARQIRGSQDAAYGPSACTRPRWTSGFVSQ